MIKYFLVVSFFITQTAHAQKPEISSPEYFSGMVIYSQQIALRNTVTTSDTLKFNRSKSFFSWNLYSTKNNTSEIKKRFPTAQVPKKITQITGQLNFFNYQTDSLYSRKSMRLLKEILYLKEKIPEIDWQITDSTKKVGNYEVNKATTHFRGRNYTAWFTPKIPVSYGPWKLHGLPGLILQAYDQTGSINFIAKKINIKNINTIGPIPLTGKEKVVNLDQYKLLMNNFRENMKKATLRSVRAVISKKNMSSITFKLPDIQLMETFKDSTDQ